MKKYMLFIYDGGFVLGGFYPMGGFVLGGFCPWGFCPGGVCPRVVCSTLSARIQDETLRALPGSLTCSVYSTVTRDLGSKSHPKDN